MDTVRADHLSVYGYERSTTPFLESLAQGGVVFENAISTSSNSLPAHTSIFTGRTVYEHGVEWNNPLGLIRSPYPVLPERLRMMGYRTAGFSANLFWITRAYGFNRGFIHFEDYNQSIADAIFSPFYGRIFERLVVRRLGGHGDIRRRRAKEINASVLDWIEYNQEDPFFVFINYMDAHDPYLPPEPYRSMFSGKPSPGGLLDCEVGRCDRPLSEEERRSEMDAYDGAIAYLDNQIKTLFQKLNEFDVMNNTLVVILSDHGEGFNEHGMYLHQHSLYREVLHVPMIFSWKDRLPAGTRISTPISITTIPATILSLLGMETQTEFPGPSLANLLTDPRSAESLPAVFSDMGPDAQVNPNRHDSGWIKSLFDNTGHYLEFEAQPAELYDWENDLTETVNLAIKPESQPQLLRMAKLLVDKLTSLKQDTPLQK